MTFAGTKAAQHQQVVAQNITKKSSYITNVPVFKNNECCCTLLFSKSWHIVSLFSSEVILLVHISNLLSAVLKAQRE